MTTAHTIYDGSLTALLGGFTLDQALNLDCNSFPPDSLGYSLRLTEATVAVIDDGGDPEALNCRDGRVCGLIKRLDEKLRGDEPYIRITVTQERISLGLVLVFRITWETEIVPGPTAVVEDTVSHHTDEDGRTTIESFCSWCFAEQLLTRRFYAITRLPRFHGSALEDAISSALLWMAPEEPDAQLIAASFSLVLFSDGENPHARLTINGTTRTII